MPHQCTSCGYLFEDGSKAMLSGCPDCGGNTFQFHPKGAPIPEIPDDDPPEPEGGAVGDTVGRATNAVRGLVNRGDQPAGAPDNHGDLDDSADDPVDDSALRDDAPDRPAPSDPLDQESVQPEPTGPAHASADPASGSGESVAEAASDESPEYGRDADVEHAPWPSEDSQDGGAGAPPDAAPTDGAGQSAHNDGNDEDGNDEDGIDEDGIDEDGIDEDGIIDDDGIDDDGIIDADAREGNTAEDVAQASARTEFVGPDELPGREGDASDAAGGGDAQSGPPGGPPSNGRVVREPTGEQPSLDELREELNDQFESIKIVNPGEYELNLMELYNREEYVVALQENGRYVIQMPENWMRNRDED